MGRAPGMCHAATDGVGGLPRHPNLTRPSSCASQCFNGPDGSSGSWFKTEIVGTLNCAYALSMLGEASALPGMALSRVLACLLSMFGLAGIIDVG